mmetsp:Transcript_34607/g.62736  ORF Transcript_34607/g.62736 Transcript_34607/m.62736 type:complete len:310 (+) Transcript_34607:86-1015(+)
MAWAIIAYFVVPLGAICATLLASGESLAVKAGSKILSTPVEIHNLKLSIAVVMTGLCGCLSLLSYAGLQRVTARAAQSKASTSWWSFVSVQDADLKDQFLQGRNYYLSLLGLTLWAFAWRLKVLSDRRQLVPPPRGVQRRPLASRAPFFALGLLALLVADVPLCRLNYQIQLATFVTPAKDGLQTTAARCENVWAAGATGDCAAFCVDVRKLSEERHSIVMFVRHWHLLGRLAAEMFDDARDVMQGSERIDKLFEKKSCAQVLSSVDKSNTWVNIFCVLLTGVSIIGSFAAFSQVFDGEDAGEQNVKAD